MRVAAAIAAGLLASASVAAPPEKVSFEEAFKSGEVVFIGDWLKDWGGLSAVELQPTVQAFESLVGFVEADLAYRDRQASVSPVFFGITKPQNYLCVSSDARNNIVPKPRAIVIDYGVVMVRTKDGKMVPAPLAEESIQRIRAKATIVIQARLSDGPAEQLASELTQVFPGTYEPGKTFFQSSGEKRDALRAEIAKQYCIVAIAGQRSADFSDRLADWDSNPAKGFLKEKYYWGTPDFGGSALTPPWGRGWFLIPLPPTLPIKRAKP